MGDKRVLRKSSWIGDNSREIGGRQVSGDPGVRFCFYVYSDEGTVTVDVPS